MKNSLKGRLVVGMTMVIWVRTKNKKVIYIGWCIFQPEIKIISKFTKQSESQLVIVKTKQLQKISNVYWFEE